MIFQNNCSQISKKKKILHITDFHHKIITFIILFVFPFFQENTSQNPHDSLFSQGNIKLLFRLLGMDSLYAHIWN